MARPARRFSIYDAMEDRGVFDSNPANASARDVDGLSTYVGPIEYPKMFYHPEGLKRVTVPAEEVVTPFGPARRNEQRELICQVARDAKEETELRTLGWHDHPAKAMEAAGEDAPPMGAQERVTSLEAQIRQLQAQLDARSALAGGSTK